MLSSALGRRSRRSRFREVNAACGEGRVMAFKAADRWLGTIIVGGIVATISSSDSPLAAPRSQDTRAAARRSVQADSVDWPQHNLDLSGSRYSPLDQIDVSNV